MSAEMKSKVPLLAKQKKESDFLKQKSGHYQKLVAAMTVHVIIIIGLLIVQNWIWMYMTLYMLCRRS